MSELKFTKYKVTFLLSNFLLQKLLLINYISSVVYQIGDRFTVMEILYGFGLLKAQVFSCSSPIFFLSSIMLHCAVCSLWLSCMAVVKIASATFLVLVLSSFV